MYNLLKNLMSEAQFFYGPVSKDTAFSIEINSYATTVNNQWYIGANERIERFVAMEIPAAGPQ